MTIRQVKLKAPKCRKSSGKIYFEKRVRGTEIRLYRSNVESAEVLNFAEDYFDLYAESGVLGGKQERAEKLHYPEYSRTSQLEPLRSDLDLEEPSHKEEALEIILRQARAAAKNLPENLRRSTPVVGNPRSSNGSASHPNVHGKLLGAKHNLPGLYPIQSNLQEISDFSHNCKMSYAAKVKERETLESMVAVINEDSGHINIPELHPDDFTSSMAGLKQLMTVAEQGYKSEHSKCLELRKLLEDHNSKVLDRSLEDGNETSGRRRANEDERLPRVPGDCPSEEQNGCGFMLRSEGYDAPMSPLLDGLPFETDTTSLAEIGVSQRVVPHEFDKVADEVVRTWEEAFFVDFSGVIGFRQEEDDGEVSNGSNLETPVYLWNWSHISTQ